MNSRQLLLQTFIKLSAESGRLKEELNKQKELLEKYNQLSNIAEGTEHEEILCEKYNEIHDNILKLEIKYYETCIKTNYIQLALDREVE